MLDRTVKVLHLIQLPLYTSASPVHAAAYPYHAYMAGTPEDSAAPTADLGMRTSWTREIPSRKKSATAQSMETPLRAG